MTDRDKMIEALAEAMAYTDRQSNDCSEDAQDFWAHTGDSKKTAWRAIAAAVVDLCGPDPLVWKTLGDGKGRYRLDSSISAARHAYGVYFVSLPCNSGSDYYWSGPAYSGSKYYPTLEAAQAAAQAHADAAHWGNTKLGDML